MEIRLAENIRAFRKQRKLTQEQLAEVLGVTVGAVYKWEAKLSQPELNMLLAMADFFDTSVDVLLGYEMKDNRLQATVERLKTYRHDKSREGLAEAEKALKKYPYAFDVVQISASLYLSFGMESRDQALLRRAAELLEAARPLLPQNTDPEISDLTLCGRIAEARLALGEADQAAALLQANNACGVYNDLIGETLAAHCNRPDEAMPYLSGALFNLSASLVRIVIGYVNVYFDRKDYASAQAILLWGTSTLSGLKNGDAPNFFDKINAVLFTCLAAAQLQGGDRSAARRSLLHARDLAESFDASPCYDMRSLRFAFPDKRASAYDDLGETALTGVQNTLADFGDDALSALWTEVNASHD